MAAKQTVFSTRAMKYQHKLPFSMLPTWMLRTGKKLFKVDKLRSLWGGRKEIGVQYCLLGALGFGAVGVYPYNTVAVSL
jgi:hypothetical protein